MLRTVLIALLIYATTLTAFAQQTRTAPTPRRSIAPISTAEWPEPAPSEKLPQSNLDIITLDKPKFRQHCQVHEIKAGVITCIAKHHRADTAYQRDEVLAIIAPPAYENLIDGATAVALLGGSLAASFFVPFAWSLTLRIISSLFFYPCWGAFGEAYDGRIYSGYHDHIRDILIYQRPDTPLTIHLHA